VGSWAADTFGETLVGTHKLGEVIEKSYGDLLAIHYMKCIHGRMEIF
jgi:hypothetical protein